MSRRGNCWDNAPQESLYGHMKDEIADKMTAWESFEDATRDIDHWFDYYNNDRYQWRLTKTSPTTILPICYHWGVSASCFSATGTVKGLCPLNREVYRLFLGDKYHRFLL